MRKKQPPLSISLIGAGNLGRTLAHLWHSRGHLSVQQVFTRSALSAQQAVEFIGNGNPHTALSELQKADIILIAVPDDQISLICKALQSLQHNLSNTIVFHCSGVMPSSELNSLEQMGASVASIHPIKSFANPEDAITSFDGTFCGVEGSPFAIDILQPLFTLLGGRCLSITPENKTLYHCAAVFANNYIVSLVECAQELYQLSGIERDLSTQLMAPILRETCENIIKLGTQGALTGPVARGDTNTVEKHLTALEGVNEEFVALYQSLGKVAFDLKGHHSKSVINDDMQKLLSRKK